MDYYVECYLPRGIKAKRHGEFQSFNEAYSWIERHLQDNTERLGRFLSRVDVGAEQMAKLRRYIIENLTP